MLQAAVVQRPMVFARQSVVELAVMVATVFVGTKAMEHVVLRPVVVHLKQQAIPITAPGLALLLRMIIHGLPLHPPEIQTVGH